MTKGVAKLWGVFSLSPLCEFPFFWGILKFGFLMSGIEDYGQVLKFLRFFSIGGLIFGINSEFNLSRAK